MSMGLRLAALFVAGTFLGSLVNWAIYSLAWFPRPISPWGAVPDGATPRGWLDRLPIVGWFRMQRESAIHGRGFWVRPLLLELGMGAAIAGLYWWEVEQLGLIRGQYSAILSAPSHILHLQFVSQVLLLSLMLAASFIDIDEKIIPDEITVPGTLLGIALATIAPMSLLPHVDVRMVPPVIGVEIAQAQAGTWYLEPVTAAAPHAWPPAWGAVREPLSLVIALACFWLWCFALTPRLWRGRRGLAFGLRVITSRILRELRRRPLFLILILGTLAILGTWLFASEAHWAGMLNSLVGMAATGGLVWGVRLIGSLSLRREAMGFGDVTLMMMIGAFLGWQAGPILFFLSPFAAIVLGLAQLIFRRDDVIPYGPFLCLAAATVVVCWAAIWTWAQPMFALGGLVPAVLVLCLTMLGVMLFFWRLLKELLLGRGA
jgi:leader peptidase (prepilin peptidase)/N-methyltransferase